MYIIIFKLYDFFFFNQAVLYNILENYKSNIEKKGRPWEKWVDGAKERLHGEEANLG